MSVHFDPQIQLIGINFKENRQKYKYAWITFIDILTIAKGGNISANQWLSEVGCSCSVEYYVGIQRMMCTEIYKYRHILTRLSSHVYLHILPCVNTRAPIRSKHAHKVVRVYTEILIVLISRECLCQQSEISKTVFFNFLLLFDIWFFHIWHTLSLCTGNKWL